jgi:hypothetical protein
MDASLNIVDLIENNPITNLTSSYQNKLINKIKENFTDTQQQLFVASFYCYLNYNQTEEFVIDLDNIWKWLGFKQKQSAKVVLEKNFIIEKDYKILLMKLHEQDKETHGGHNKQTILLTIKTFKLLCIKAETTKANEIHEYYIKLEELLNLVIKEECNDLRLLLEENKKDFNIKLEQEKVLQREQVLLKEYDSCGPIVYIIKVKTLENGKYIVKIGESRIGIEGRYAEHKKNYPECILLNCYSVIKSKDFENFIHSNEKIRPHKVKDLQGHEKENELFLIGNELTYKILTKIIENNIKHYNEYSKKDFELLQSKNELLQLKIDLLQMENENLKQQLITNQPNIEQIVYKQIQTQLQEIHEIQKQNQTYIHQQMENLEKQNNVLINNQKSSSTTILTGFQQPKQTIGPRLQKINPENLSLIKVYETVSEALNETNQSLKRPSIQKAINENTIYQGFRWAYVGREQDPNIVNIPPTRQVQVQNVGYIAKLNKEKTEIVNVYIDRKTASLQNGFISASALDIPVKKDKPVNGFYYILFDKCSQELQNNFINKNGYPILYKDGVGQYDLNGTLIQEFICKYDCIKKLKMSDKTLAKTLDKEISYNNHYFRRLPEKIVC